MSQFSEDTCCVYGAIDIGTAFSGYAFSMKRSEHSNEIKIMMNKNWGAASTHTSYKCPTSVLVDENCKFIDFGYEAEKKYVELKSNQTCFLFRHFKMLLYNSQHLSDKTTISSIDHKKKMNAVDVFSMAVDFLKNHLLNEVKAASVKSLDNHMIKWVLTVPAIWTDNAKSFMRKVAYKAGLIESENSKQLLIALEPEAAAIYCHDVYSDDSMKPGDKYIVVDAGGGTVDITTHEVLDSGGVKEVSEPKGGSWGGVNVDKKFKILLEQLFGTAFINDYKDNSSENWLKMMVQFEKMKPDFETDKENYAFDLSYHFYDSFKRSQNTNIDRQADIQFSNGALKLNKNQISNLFFEPLCAIISCLKTIIGQNSYNYILLVGGFAESKLLQDSIRKKFQSDAKIIIPLEPQTAILKGAVMFGHNPFYIRSRIAKFSYGYNIQKLFIEGVHDERYKFNDNGRDWCTDLFKTVIRKGDEIDVGTKISHLIGTEEMRETSLALYRSVNEEVKYVYDFGVEKLGVITIIHEPPYCTTHRKILDVQAEFGGTEITFSAKLKDTNNWWNAVVKFN